ncbi:MAG: hypothetical protein VYA30_16460 [Myxococcota bacterium]|nr:hypothetical protein [Myxococcota bacterium]
MSPSIQNQITSFMLEFRSLVIHVESSALTLEHAVVINERMVALAEKADVLRLAVKSHREKGMERVLDALHRFQSLRLSDLNARQLVNEFSRLSQTLAERYEHILDALRQTPMFETIARSIGTLRPTNYWRNLFHAAMGITGAFVYEYLTITRSATLIALGVLLVIYVFLDQIRRLDPRLNEIVYRKLFGLISRPREQYQTPAGIWYVVGLMSAVAIAEQTHAQIAAIVLGLADPAASLVGKKWGVRKIFRDRSWLGTVTFVLVGCLASALFLLHYRAWSLSLVCITALVAAVSGALAEMVSGDRIDDNLSIPLAISTSLTMLAWLTM